MQWKAYYQAFGDGLCSLCSWLVDYCDDEMNQIVSLLYLNLEKTLMFKNKMILVKLAMCLLVLYLCYSFGFYRGMIAGGNDLALVRGALATDLLRTYKRDNNVGVFTTMYDCDISTGIRAYHLIDNDYFFINKNGPFILKKARKEYYSKMKKYREENKAILCK